jgi:hypothetical protein
MNVLYLNCPHCEDLVEIYESELNCRIFRHGIFKNNFEQINPHLPKNECDNLKEKDLIYGCGKPFQVYKENDEYKIKICEYI